MILTCVIVFACGVLYEMSCVWWTHHSERGNAVATALLSMLCATTQVTGILDSVHDWRIAPFFVLGYGCGAVIAISLKNKIRRE